MNDDAFQTIAMQIATKASVGFGQPWQRLDAERAEHVVDDPVWYSKNQRKIRPANTSGSAHGSSSPRRTGHLTRNGWLASSARPRPTTSAPGTVTTM